MATDQSALQGFVQNMAGTQTTAQSAVPSATNNGNPNTVYNWSTYLPQFTGGQNPTASFDLLAAQAPASSPGYTPPFAADPYAAAVMSGIPQAAPNDNVNRILSNIFGGNNPWGQTPAPGTGVPAPGTPGPGTPAPGTPTPGTRPPGGLPSRPVGPISGPVDNWVRDGSTGQPPNTTAPTTIFQGGNGREYAMDWLRQNNGANFESVADFLRQNGGFEGEAAQARTEDGTGWWDRAVDWIGDKIENGIEEISNWSLGQWADAISEVWIPGDFVNDETGKLNDPLTAMGVNQIADYIRTLGDPDEPVTQEQIDAVMENINNIQGEVLDNQMQEMNDTIQSSIDNYYVGLDGQSNRERTEDWYNQQAEWTPQEWQNITESMAWNNMWHSSDQVGPSNSLGGRQPTVGLPAVDNMDVFLNNMARHNVGISEWFRNMRGRAQQ